MIKINWIAFLLLMVTDITGFSQEYYSFSDKMQMEVTLQPGNFLYVDDDNTSGPWSGTEANPFENIPEGLAAATPGVTVVVKPGNYLITQDITVPADVNLFLFHGDTIRFGTNINMDIAGRLQAFGNANDSIYFTSSLPGNSWDGIRFLNSQLISELRYCHLTNGIGTDGNKGGGMYVSGSSVKLFGCRFQNNNANYGAAVYCDSNSSLVMDNCEISGNNATISGGGLYGFSTDSLLIYNCSFYNNNATSNGGAIALKDLKTNLLQNNFSDNDANNGGAAYFDNVNADSAMFSWNTVKSNTAAANGGGLYINNSSSIDISRNLILNNSADDGGAVYISNSAAIFYNNNLFSNIALNFGGGLTSNNGNNEIFNNIIWGNFSSDGSQIAGSGINANYNNIEGGYPGIDNISAYPLFVDTATDNFILQYSSPCINRGNPVNAPDPDSTIADIGIYYFHHQLHEITEQPVDATVNVGNNTSIDLNANWVSSYQWQISQDEGISWTDVSGSIIYSGFTTHTLQISNAQLSMDGYKFRCKVFGAGTIAVLSDEVVLTVHPVIKTLAAISNTCVGDILVPVNVSNCNAVAAISLVLFYNETMLTFNGYQNSHNQLSSGTLFVNSFSGKIIISWASITPANIGDDLLLEIMFTSTAGSSTLVWDTITPGNCEYSDYNGNIFISHYSNGSVTTAPCATQLDLKVFLEGPYNGTDMNTGLNHSLPISQPFNIAPWNYTGTENVVQIPSGSIVDWGLIELRETVGNASTATESTIVARQAVFIRKDGGVKGLDGSNLPFFSEVITNNLYVVIRHRNHLPIMSAAALSLSNGSYTYNFATGSGQVYGGSLGHKEIGTSVWGMFSGDGDADGSVNIIDNNNIWAIQAGNYGYLMGDFDLNTQVDNEDKNKGWLPNNGSGTQVPN